MYILENIYCHIDDKILLPICHDNTMFIDVFILCFTTFLGPGSTFITSLIGIGILTALVEQVCLMSLMSVFLAPVVAFKLLSHHNTLTSITYFTTIKHLSYYTMYKWMPYHTTLDTHHITLKRLSCHSTLKHLSHDTTFKHVSQYTTLKYLSYHTTLKHVISNHLLVMSLQLQTPVM